VRVLLLAEVTAEQVIGGAERVLRNQAVGLAALGHRVELLTRAPVGAVEDAIAVGGLRECRYAVNRAHEAAFLWSSVRRSVDAFDRLRRTEPLDAVVIHQALAGLGPILLRRHAASRWIYVCHSLAHEEFGTRQAPPSSAVARVRRQINLRGRRWVEQTVMKRCDRVVVLSQFMRRRVMATHGIPSDRIVVIPGATDPRVFAPVPDRQGPRAALNLPADRTVLFTVRNLVPRMGLENFIDAIAASGAAGLGCVAVIGGEGPLRAALDARIRSRGLEDVVRLVGFIPESQLPQYFQAADLVVMPTLHLEGFGLVTVEALACGTPVLGTPVGAIPEILNQVDPTLVAAGSDSRALASALEQALRRIQEPGEADRLAQTGRRLVEQQYNWTRHCAELSSILNAVSEERRAA
jgi:glycosyltransferase involved in cell wall biosynthesis